jgi:Protein of unknown function (DUF2855)
MSYDFLVNQADLKQTLVRQSVAPDAVPLAAQEILLQVEHFAFTSNNVTYAAFGKAMHYWDFFPAGPGDQEWGRIPVWGFATVTRLGSNAPEGIALGERFYGYFPMSSYVVLTPGKLNASGFADVAPHRAHLNAVYNKYRRCSTDASYRQQSEAQQMLLQPLFMTGFVIDDFLADNAFFGASQVVLSSASSKTSYSTAFQLRQRKDITLIGLTSAANTVFVNGLGCYDQVLTYEEISHISTAHKSVYVDMAGNAKLRLAVHSHLQDALTYSCSVGGTHWDSLSTRGQGGAIPGPKPTLFFAPAQIGKRLSEWGPKELQQRMDTAWLAFLPQLDDWMHVSTGQGEQAVSAVYQDMLAGRAAADQGYILSL